MTTLRTVTGYQPLRFIPFWAGGEMILDFARESVTSNVELLKTRGRVDDAP